MDTYAFEAELSSIIPVGLTVRGLRIDIGVTGRITEGRLSGCTITGVDYLLIRPDGVGVIDVRELVSDGDRVIASVRAEGYAVPPVPLPELSVLADPGFEWPDIDFSLHGAAFWETADEGLASAATTVYGFTGSGNIVTRVLKVSARSLARSAQPVG